VKVKAESKQFILREVTEKDIEGFYAFDLDPEVHKKEEIFMEGILGEAMVKVNNQIIKNNEIASK